MTTTLTVAPAAAGVPTRTHDAAAKSDVDLDFVLDAMHEAHEPPEAHGQRRDGVRLLVSPGTDAVIDATFADLGAFLEAGDLIVVNTSATIPAAADGRLPGAEPVVVHLSGALPGGLSLVEVRQPREGATAPLQVRDAVTIDLLGGGHVRLLAPFAGSHRLWCATFDLATDIGAFLEQFGRPIRYRHVPHDWPLGHYQTVFAREPGSAEMPSASRPFTHELVTDLVARGVRIAPLVLHTGVSSLEGDERPYPERYRVPRTTAAMINSTAGDGGRVIAAGTTAVRALSTVTDEHGQVHPGSGWTDVVVTPKTSIAPIDGLITGWHEPESSHLMMLSAFASHGVLADAYGRALDLGFRWHEFGDSHLILRDRARA